MKTSIEMQTITTTIEGKVMKEVEAGFSPPPVVVVASFTKVQVLGGILQVRVEASSLILQMGMTWDLIGK